MASSDGKATRAVMRLSPPDNVAVALRHLKSGETVMLDDVPLKVSRNTAVGHKLAAQEKAGYSIARLIDEPERQAGFSGSGSAQNQHARALDTDAGSMQEEVGLCHHFFPGGVQSSAMAGRRTTNLAPSTGFSTPSGARP